MKQYFLLWLIMFSLCCAAQNIFKHPSLISVSFIENDFKNKIPLKRIDNLDAGLSLGFIKGINQRFDWQLTYSGSFPDSSSNQINHPFQKQFLSELDLSLRLRVFPREVAVQPYILTGVGFGFIQNKLSSYLVIGSGLQCHFKDVYVQLAGLYKRGFAGSLNQHYTYSLGVGGRINKPKVNKKARTVVTSNTQAVTIIKDIDGDGIVDSADRCPTIAGLLKFNGCPDSDLDGIPDIADKCPAVFGKEKYQGCPAPDTDGDGINDEEDSCITVPGVIQKNGCPEVTAKSIQSLNIAASKIYFETGKSVLLPQSFSALDTV